MFIVDEEQKLIHDMSFIRYECQVRKIPEDKKKKLYSIQTVKTMCSTDTVPRYNGCQYCMSEYHVFDFTRIFR